MYAKDEWLTALETAESLEWDDVDIQESGNFLSTALLAAYEKFEQDVDKVAAAIEAASQRFNVWDADNFGQVVSSYSTTLDNWQELAQNFIDDHWPGFPIEELDLEKFAKRHAKRDEEIYVEDSTTDELHIFRKSV